MSLRASSVVALVWMLMGSDQVDPVFVGGDSIVDCVARVRLRCFVFLAVG